MVKKIVVFLCFFAGATCFISAGLYINRQNAGLEPQKTEETVSKVKSPELLSEIDMTSYVSLPESFSDIALSFFRADAYHYRESLRFFARRNYVNLLSSLLLWAAWRPKAAFQNVRLRNINLLFSRCNVEMATGNVAH